MPLGSFIDQPWVVPGIIGAFLALIFVLSVAGVGRRRPLGIILVTGVLALLALIAFTDWVIDDLL